MSSDDKDSKEEKQRKAKNAMYERKRIEEIVELRDLFTKFGWIDSKVSEPEKYAQMMNQLNFLDSSKDMFINDFLEKDPDLREFMAVHSTDATKRHFFVKTLKEIKERKVKIPNDPGLIALIKAFEGMPMKVQTYPISITFDGISFAVKDIPFEAELDESKVEQWRNTPILVL
jgi:hypothetical protein